MRTENIERTKEVVPTTMVSIRISEAVKSWLKENDYSPTALFREACKDLGFGKQKKEKKVQEPEPSLPVHPVEPMEPEPTGPSENSELPKVTEN